MTQTELTFESAESRPATFAAGCTMKQSSSLFDRVSVNLATGEVSYPQLAGFVLDHEAVYRAAALFAPYCSPEMAVRHAIHQQLAAYQGAMSLQRRSR